MVQTADAEELRPVKVLSQFQLTLKALANFSPGSSVRENPGI
jgi:hypothetical protein